MKFLKKFRASKPKARIGIDCRADSVRAVRFEGEQTPFPVSTYEAENLSQLLAKLGPAEQLVLRFNPSFRNWKEWRFSGNWFVEGDLDERRAMIRYESERWLPYPVEQSHLGYRPLSYLPDKEQTLVQIRQVPSELIEPLAHELGQSELAPVMGIEVCSLACLQRLLPKGEVALVQCEELSPWALIHPRRNIVPIREGSDIVSQVKTLEERYSCRLERIYSREPQGELSERLGVDFQLLVQEAGHLLQRPVPFEFLVALGAALSQPTPWWMKPTVE